MHLVICVLFELLVSALGSIAGALILRRLGCDSAHTVIVALAVPSAV